MKISNLTRGIVKENPIFVQLLGMCPTLAVTTSMENGIGMGLATTAVLAMSNLLISLIRKLVPEKIRIPIFVVIIATFVTIVEMFMEAYMGALYSALGLFIPLIVVNCIILARAESFASVNGPIDSLFDGIGMGLGFTLSLSILGLVREILGTGSLILFGKTLFSLPIPPTITMILPPGAFLVLGLLIALKNAYTMKKEA